MEMIRLMRPLQWAKNLFVFLPMFFSGNLLNGASWRASIMMFVSFCLTASSVYCLNDLCDAEADRQHPQKKSRPVASGAVSAGRAIGLGVVLLLGGLAVAYCAPGGLSPLAIVGVYYVINVAYCLWLKHIAIVDVFIVSLGFVLRILGGGSACGIWVSPWLICLTFLLALFLSFAKRRDDVLLAETAGIRARSNIMSYNTRFLDQTLGITAAVTMMSYIIYSVSPEVMARFGSEYVYTTSIFVLAGILRYLQLTIVEGKSVSPTKILLDDLFVQLSIAGWLLSFVVIIYL